MSIKFEGTGSFRIDTTLDSHSMSVYGVCSRHANLASRQWFAGIHTSSTSAYIINQGALPGSPNEDAFINGLAVDKPEVDNKDIYLIREWGVSATPFVDTDLNELFTFAIIGYMSASQPMLKCAVRKFGESTIHSEINAIGGYSWTNAKVHLGAGSGNMFPARHAFSKIAILNTNAEDDVSIAAVMDSLGTIDGTYYSYLDGFAVDVAAGLLDDTVNNNDWSVNPATGHSVIMDTAHESADYLLVTGIASMPVGSTGAVPTAPSGLGISPVDARTVAATWTDNSSDETEFVLQRKTDVSTNPAEAEAWHDVVSVLAGSVTAHVGALVPGRTYEFRVRADNEYGQSAYSNIVSFTMSQFAVEALVEPEAMGLGPCAVTVWFPPLATATETVGTKVAVRQGTFDAGLTDGKARMQVQIPAQVGERAMAVNDVLEVHIAYMLRDAAEQQSVICHDAKVIEVS